MYAQLNQLDVIPERREDFQQLPRRHVEERRREAPGTVILLNGVGSAGKTSIATALQAIFDGPLLLLGMDLFIGSVAPRRYVGDGDHATEGFAFVAIEGADPPETAIHTGPFADFLLAGLHRAAATLSAMGHNVVVDHVFWERRWLDDCAVALRDLPVVSVGVHCPLAVAEARAYARADRPPVLRGAVRWLFPRVHTGAIYDLEVETASATAMACAVQIKRHLDAGLPMTAIRRLADRAGAERA
jgi:chloramphenicol 3-O phosphotransferase